MFVFEFPTWNCHHVAVEVTMRHKRVQLDDETWRSLDQIGDARMQDFQELADEAFADLIRKHGRPSDLSTAHRLSMLDICKRPPGLTIKLVKRKKTASDR
jgi:hypothetical protein